MVNRLCCGKFCELGEKNTLNYKSIAIDGPSGAGKSSMARALAKEMHYVYVDTGAIYRTVGLAAHMNGISVDDIGNIVKILPELKIELCYCDEGGQRMKLNGVDVTSEIRSPIVSSYASRVSALSEVRQFLLEMQRDIAKNNNVIMDGRDIGTVVLPNADLKLFVTASARVRAERRQAELTKSGKSMTLDEVQEAMSIRDDRDENREAAPLKQAEDAIFFDTSELPFDIALAELKKIIGEKIGI